MPMLFQLRTFWLDLEEKHQQADRLRRAGYLDGEPRPRHRSYWANR